MGGVVALPLRVSRRLSTSVDCEREASFGAHTSTPLRWIANVSCPPDRSVHFGGQVARNDARSAPPRRSPLRQCSTTRSTRDPITSVTPSRSSRRSHSPVTPPSGEATTGSQTSVRLPVANDTHLEQSGQLWPRVELARHSDQSTWNQHPRVATPVPDAQHAKPLRRCSCPAHYTDVPARHRDTPTRRCGHTL
jgi:hypothetical protein